MYIGATLQSSVGSNTKSTIHSIMHWLSTEGGLYGINLRQNKETAEMAFKRYNISGIRRPS